ncbi:unnamed protein product [Nezara viridula]|uniref:Uncharacterized protein n=1 Tax=Nezara viridula TaxID=85310 RepID=A0A9P0GYA4_NEZVI|nr:unnamed protein product [Nezara viridula]
MSRQTCVNLEFEDEDGLLLIDQPGMQSVIRPMPFKAADEEIKETADEKMKETADDGKDCGDTVVSEGSVATEMVCESEPSTTELENNLAGDKEILNEKQTMHEDEPRSDNVNPDLPEVGDESVGIASETEKGVTVIDITANDGPSNPEDNVIDVSDSEGVETDKGPTSEDDGIINVDLSEGTDQSSNSEDVTVVNSPASQEAERPGKKDGESGMETEDGDDRTNAQSAENIVDDDDDDVHLDGTNKKSGSKQADQPDIDEMDIEAEVARLVSEVEETAEVSPSKAVENEGRGGEDKEKHPDKESAPKEAIQPQEIVLQDTTNLEVRQFLNSTFCNLLPKLPLTTPVTFRIAPASNTPPSSSSSSGRGRGRRKGMRGMRGTNRHVVPRASSSNDNSHNSIDLFRHLTRTRTVFDFPTFVTDVDDDIQYWKLCQILKESFHELIETRNTKTSIGKLTLRVALNRPKKPKVQQNNGESETDPQ